MCELVVFIHSLCWWTVVDYYFYISISTPNSEYLRITMYYTLGDIYKWVDYRKVGYIDYCRGDKISKLEIVNMAKELNLHVEGSTFLVDGSERLKVGTSRNKK